MTRKLLAAALLLCALSARAQTPVFDIATIKPHKPGDNSVNVNGRPGNYEASNISLKNLISGAYGIRDFLIFGLPKWAEDARYDIQAKVSDPDIKALEKLDRDQRRGMMVTLLKERFGLVAHNETKVQSIYELSVDPEGLKLHETPAPPVVEGETPKKPSSTWSTHNSEFEVKNATMAALADNLAAQVERFVVDKTALTAGYSFNLRWTPDDASSKPDNGAPGDPPPSIFTALKEQLGLKLTAARGPVPTLVIDNIKPPDLD